MRSLEDMEERELSDLLEKGLSPDSMTGSGADKTSLLGAAALYGRGDLVKLLLKHGANPNLRDAGGDIPLYAALTGHTEIHRIVQALIDGGADPNLIPSTAETLSPPFDSPNLLFFTVFWRDPDSMRVLLSAGGDPSIMDKEGKTPLDIALKYKKAENNITSLKLDEMITMLTVFMEDKSFKEICKGTDKKRMKKI